MISDSTTLTSARFVTVPPSGIPHGTANTLSFFPTQGQNFGILTSGNATFADAPNNSENAGVNLGGPNNIPGRGTTAYDITVLEIGVSTPPSANCLRFDFAFYSEEYPEYVGRQYNDTFIAELDHSTWAAHTSITAPNNFAFDDRGAVVSINSTGATSMNGLNAGGTTYDGATVLLQAATAVSPGAHKLYLSILDQGDAVYDSAVFVDNIRFENVSDPAVDCRPGAQRKITPLIIAPGIGGSKLFNKLDGQTVEQWPAVERLAENITGDGYLYNLILGPEGEDPYPNNQDVTVKVGDIIRRETGQVDIPFILHQPFDEDVYETTINTFTAAHYKEGSTCQPGGASGSSDETLFPFPYDWRKSVELAADKLLECIDKVRKQTGATQVDILAHSMGGMVTRVALTKPTSKDSATGKGKVRKVLTLGTPVLGAPKALAILEYQAACFIEPTPGQCITDKGTTQAIAGNWLGVYQLLPSRSFDQAETAPLLIDHDTNGDKQNEGPQGYDQWSEIVEAHRNGRLLASADTYHKTYDQLKPADPSVQMFRVVGDSLDTPRQVREYRACTLKFFCSTEYEILHGNGDGTVPIHSADLYNPETGFDFRAGFANAYAHDVEHGSLPTDPSVLAFAKAYFGVTPPAAQSHGAAWSATTPPIQRHAQDPRRLPATRNRSSSAATAAVQLATSYGLDDIPQPMGGIELEVLGPVSGYIQDSSGKILGSNVDAPDALVFQTIPGGMYTAIANTRSFFLNTDGSYAGKLKVTTANAARLRVRTYASDRLSGQAVFNVDAGSGTGLQLDFATGQDLSTLRLRIDYNGDGVVDQVAAPDSVVVGSTAADTQAPTTIATVQKAGSLMNIALTASDNPGGSGVAATYYMVVGVDQQARRYTEPFTAPAMSMVRFASADRAGNMEVTRFINYRVYLPMSLALNASPGTSPGPPTPTPTATPTSMPMPTPTATPTSTPTTTPPTGSINQIAFVSARGGNYGIYKINADGTNVSTLSTNSPDESGPAWSPDGNLIVFASRRDGNDEIYVMNADGTNQRRLTNSPGVDRGPEWSPDGNSIVFSSDRDGNREIYVMNADGTNQRRLTNNSADDREPTWSPGGNLIAFRSNRAGNQDIWVMNADGTQVRNLTAASGDDSGPDWSPNGALIAFSSTRDGNEEIYVMNADGTNPRRLTNHSAVDRGPTWSPGGNSIGFSSARDGNREIYAINADGSSPRRLTNHSAEDIDPMWSPR